MASGSSEYLTFSRCQWRSIASGEAPRLSEADLAQVRGLNEPLDPKEVHDVYVTLADLLLLHRCGTRCQRFTISSFLKAFPARIPYVIAIAGSVAVGKSTIARLLRMILEKSPGNPSVEIMPTDGFLFPNAILEARNLMRKKGFPESYDLHGLIDALRVLRRGESTAIPEYSHVAYDILPGRTKLISSPDILIVEGLNVLQARGASQGKGSRLLVSDFFDFSVYVDARPEHLESWYVQRFRLLRDTAFQDPTSFFHHYADLSDAEADRVAENIWAEVNGPNLLENIEGSKERADLILSKGANHRVESVSVRTCATECNDV